MLDQKLSNDITETAVKMLKASQDFKQPRIEKLKEYEDLRAGKVPARLRAQFNVPLPYFAGMLDTLNADYYDKIKVIGEAAHPADYKPIKKINAAWDQEVGSNDVDADFDYKNRIDITLATFTGLGIKGYYSESDPKYRSELYNVHFANFHAEPRGGGRLEKHLFCGEESIFKTRQQLEQGVRDDIYDGKQVGKIIAKAQSNEYKSIVEEEKNKQLARFQALGLDVEANNYVGQEMFHLCQFNLTYKGKRRYLLFDPLLREWIRCENLKDLYGMDLYQWDFWQTHEDLNSWISSSYSDYLHPAAMSLIEFVSQEMTNRSKRNMGSKLYDRAAIYDVAKLDAAQYFPDRLVPVNTKNGTVKLAETVHTLETPELKGTLDMVNWVESTVARLTGISDLDQKQLGKKASVAFAFLQQAQKRISHKSAARIESWGRVYTRFIQGLVDNLSGEGMAIKMIGSDGFEWWDELNRLDLDLKGKYSVKVISTTEQDAQNVLGKDQKAKAMETILGNPNLAKELNTKVAVEFLLSDVGGWDGEAVIRAMDVKDYGNKDLIAEADFAISLLLKGKWPDICHAATVSWAKKILRFEQEHESKMEGRKVKRPDGVEVPMSILFMDYVNAHKDIISKNMERKAQSIRTAGNQSNPDGQTEGAPPAAGKGVPPQKPNQTPVSRKTNIPRVGVTAGAQ